MDIVTFGEFLRLADERLAAAEATLLPAEPDIAGEVHELRRVVAGMLGYLRDITPGQHAEAIALTAKSLSGNLRRADQSDVFSSRYVGGRI